MSREIEFRGLDIKTNEWQYGYLVSGNHVESYINYNNTWIMHFGRLQGALKKTEVKPETVGQYTGLKDRNGVKIFENDVIVIDMWQGNEHGYIPEDGVIKWHDESSAFKWFSGEPSDGNNYWLSQADAKQREVIGNIHQNPELLK